MTRRTAAPGVVEWERLDVNVSNAIICGFCEEYLQKGEFVWMGVHMSIKRVYWGSFAAHPVCLDAAYGTEPPDSDPGPDLEG